MSNLESSNPVSHANGGAPEPFCWGVVATNDKQERWLVEWYESEALAKAMCSVIKAHPHETYSVEPLCLGSTLSSLRAEYAALKTENAKLWNTLSMTRDDVFVGWGDVELLDPTLERLDATLNAGARDP